MGSSPEVWPLTEPSAGGPGSLRLPGRVLTASYAAVASDSGQPLVFNSATPVTLTLPASVVSADWFIVVQNIGAGTLTVARNGRTIDGASSDLALAQNQGVVIFTEGANYFTERGVGGGGLRAVASIDAGTLASGAQATGSVTATKSGLGVKVVAAVKSRLRIYQTSAGRDSDTTRAYGTVPPGSVGLLLEIRWTGTATLSYPLQPTVVLANGDGTPAKTLYWTVENLETGSAHPTFDLTYVSLEN